MNWSFGIITDGSNHDRVVDIVRSIRHQDDGGKHEIVIVGGNDDRLLNMQDAHLLYLPFDEDRYKAWITKKKNMIAQIASANNLCIMHDYVAINPGWTSGFESFGNNWLTCMTPIHNQDGKRFRDWCVIYNDAWMNPPINDEVPPETPPGQLLDYDVSTGHERWQYFSGAYFCVKRDVLLDVPFDEDRVWGQGEDVQWSRLLYQQYGEGVFSLNKHSSVRFLKQKDRAPWEQLAPLQ